MTTEEAGPVRSEDRAEWRVRWFEAPPAALLAGDVDRGSGPEIRVIRPRGDAVVLGSTQPKSLAEPRTPGVDVVRRRAGGGAVLLSSGGPLWVEVLVPMTHRHHHDDVSRAPMWVGAAFAHAIGQVAGGPVDVLGPSSRPGRHGRIICFADGGPGEVRRRGAKVVGIAQRRTREAALFQCAMLTADPRGDQRRLANLLPGCDRAELSEAIDALPAETAGVDAPVTDVVSVLLDALTR